LSCIFETGRFIRCNEKNFVDTYGISIVVFADYDI
jgi:hypothetical protein